jgi:hypothetical protein
MERDTIERLAIDRALGELDADILALFEAYLAEHDQARQWAESMGKTCGRTREAVTQKTRRDDAIAWPEPVRRLPIHRIAMVRWAAVIVVSALLGVTIGRWSSPSQMQTPETVVIRTATAGAGPEGWQKVLSEPQHGFWQSKALAMLESQPNEIPRQAEPRPGLWNRYRQFRKERSREEVY